MEGVDQEAGVPGSEADTKRQPGADAGASQSLSKSSGENLLPAPRRGRRRVVIEKPGRFRDVYSESTSALDSIDQIGHGKELTMTVPTINRRTVILFLLLSSAWTTSFAIELSSSSLMPPRLLTRRMTSSFPSCSYGRNERSVSVVSMM